MIGCEKDSYKLWLIKEAFLLVDHLYTKYTKGLIAANKIGNVEYSKSLSLTYTQLSAFVLLLIDKKLYAKNNNLCVNDLINKEDYNCYVKNFLCLGINVLPITSLFGLYTKESKEYTKQYPRLPETEEPECISLLNVTTLPEINVYIVNPSSENPYVFDPVIEFPGTCCGVENLVSPLTAFNIDLATPGIIIESESLDVNRRDLVFYLIRPTFTVIGTDQNWEGTKTVNLTFDVCLDQDSNSHSIVQPVNFTVSYE